MTSLWRPSRPLDLGERPPGRKSPVEHVEIADAADLVLVAPATADFLARAAVGLADDALTATLLATAAPVVIAPSMNVQMWGHPATRENVAKLRARDVIVVAPEEGELACGWEGRGRLASLEVIAEAVRAALSARKTAVSRTSAAGAPSMSGRHVVVSAGPTREALDPVRYLSNHSSGKMGYAIAEEARDRGASVTLVTGPTSLARPSGMKVVEVASAAEMKRALDSAASRADAVVMAAAVADFRPARPAASKIRRSEEALDLRLVATPDILKGLPRKAGRVMVGFALETGGGGGGLAGARRKLEEKGCDLVVLNDPTRADSAFGGDTNRVTLVGPRGAAERLPALSKREVAARVWDRVQSLWRSPSARPRVRRAASPAPRRAAKRSR